MIKYYIIESEKNKVVVTRNDVANLVTTADMSEEDQNKAIYDYLEDHGAVVYSDISFNEYQDFTKTTAIYPKNKALEYLCLGLASEAGEVAGKLKKVIRDHKGFDHDTDKALLKEIGDVLWYCARIADELGGSLSEIAEENMAKLKDRQVRGKLGGSGDNR